MTPKRIQLRRTRGYRKPPGAIVVRRPTHYGNPFNWRKLGKKRAVELFKEYIDMLLDPEQIAELRGHDLACTCKLCPAHADGLPLGVKCDKCDPCHATELLRLANK